MKITIKDAPMPPQSNNMYITRGRFRVKSPETRAFEAAWDAFVLTRSPSFAILREKIKPFPAFRVSCLFKFPKSKVFTLDGKIKKMDVSNRIKAIHDAFSQTIGRDDSEFFEVMAEKVVASEDDKEGVDICIEGLHIAIPEPVKPKRRKPL